MRWSGRHSRRRYTHSRTHHQDGQGAQRMTSSCSQSLFEAWSSNPMLPKQTMPFVDIRDVCEAHLEAVLRDEANDKRFILCAECPYLVELAKALEQKFGKDYPVRAKEMPKIIPMIMRLWNAEMAVIYRHWGKGHVFDGSRATEILGVEYIGHEKSLVDMGESLIATGCIADSRGLEAVTLTCAR